MNWIQAGRILLVCPASGQVLNRKLDMNLVLRHATSMGAQLALVSDDAQVRFYAQQLEIPLFDNPREAQESQWISNGNKVFSIKDGAQRADLDDLKHSLLTKIPTWLDRPAAKFICLAVSVLALFALGFIILPSAKVIYSPQVEYQSMVFALIANPGISSINYSTGSLPTHIQELIIEGQATIAATGSMTIPDKPATGDLLFTNHSDHTISIPAGTIVTTIGTDPVRFITTSLEDTRVDGSESVVLTAQAVTPGLAGNLVPHELETILEGSDPDLTVTNPTAMTGGTEATVSSPSAQDLSNVRQGLVSKLMQDALVEMQSTIPRNDILITPTLANLETLTENSFPSVGEPGNQLELTLKLRVQAQVISASTLQSFVNPIMDSYTPKGYSPLVDTLEITRMSLPILGDDGKAVLTIQVTRQVQADITVQQAAGLISGRTISQAIRHLSSFLPLAENPTIILNPNWWPRLPFLAMRIEFVRAGTQ